MAASTGSGLTGIDETDCSSSKAFVPFGSFLSSGTELTRLPDVTSVKASLAMKVVGLAEDENHPEVTGAGSTLRLRDELRRGRK